MICCMCILRYVGLVEDVYVWSCGRQATGKIRRPASACRKGIARRMLNWREFVYRQEISIATVFTFGAEVYMSDKKNVFFLEYVFWPNHEYPIHELHIPPGN
jgi:hypothetical protein